MATDIASANPPGLCLDILAQAPFLNKLYTQITSCFATSHTVADEDIIGTLRLGLGRLAASVPWVAGQVVRNDPGNGCGCDFSIVPWTRAPRLVVKELRGDPSAPTMEKLRTAGFPMHALDESMLSPCKTLSSASDMTPYVFTVQATFISGGVLLTFVAQHNTMDMVGQGEIIRLLSKACRGVEFTQEEITNANADRHNIIPLFDDCWQPGSELDEQTVKQPSGPPSPPPQCTWGYFGFSGNSLAEMKAVASETAVSSTGYVSTDDTLSAFIWQCVTRVRLGRLEHSATSTFARAVDVRPFLGACNSPAYPGLLQNMTYNKLAAAEVVSQPLGVVASHLRSSLDPEDLSYRTRALATVLRRSSDKSSISFTANVDPSTDISFSSWAKVNLYDLDFNLGLGKPEAIRRPRFDTVESLMYTMPRAPDGELVVGLCLRDEDMDGLRADRELTIYGRYIG